MKTGIIVIAALLVLHVLVWIDGDRQLARSRRKIRRSALRAKALSIVLQDRIYAELAGGPRR